MAAPAPLHLRRSDLVGVALVIAVAWITSHTSHPRYYIIPSGRSASLSTRIRSLHATAIAVAAVVRFYALSQTPLVLAVAAYATTLAVITTSRSSKEHPVDYTRNVCWSVIMICGCATVGATSITDQQITPSSVRDAFTRVAVLQQLLVWAVAALGVLIWIHESHYMFATEKSWTRHIRRLRWDVLARRDEQTTSDARARAFAVLSGLAAACAMFCEKCLAEMLRTRESNSSGVLTAAWIATRALESYWWHHAILIDPSRTVPLLHPYICVGIVQGILFFDEIHHDHALAGAAGLAAIFTALASVQFHAPIFAPKHDPSPAGDAAPLLLGAAESLLDSSPPSDGVEATHVGEEDASRGSYRPPAHFRVL